MGRLSDDDETDPESIQFRIEELRNMRDAKIGYLMDSNQRATAALRLEAKSFEKIAQFYIDLAEDSLEISSMSAELALLTAKLTGDLLIAEFGEKEEDEDDDD